MSSSFLDIYLDEQIPGWPCNSSPRFSTNVTRNAAGGEKRNRNWAHPLHNFTLPEAVRYHATFEALRDHWMVVGGRESTFPFRDPLDFASCPLEEPNVIPDFAGDDEALGQGDDFTRDFQLYKTYSRPLAGGGEQSYRRPIYLPITESLIILINGVLPEDAGVLIGGPYTWTVSRPGGVVRFTPALHHDAVATWGGLFDTEVRFERDDSFDGIVQNFRISGFADLTLVETRRC